MSSIATSSNFQSILDAALDNYVKQTGIDLTKHPSADQFQDCHSPDDVFRLLLHREKEFKDYRDKYRALIDRLSPVVKVVHVFSNILGDAAGLVSSWDLNMYS
jgi:fungal STAND N-terminal Goodbye domain